MRAYLGASGMQRRLPRFSGTPSWPRRLYLLIGVYDVFFLFLERASEHPPFSLRLRHRQTKQGSPSTGKLRAREIAASHGLRVFASDFNYYVLRIIIIACLHAVVPYSLKIDFARNESRYTFRNNYIIRYTFCNVYRMKECQTVPWESYHFR